MAQSPARWLAWATAVLLVVGIGAAGAVSGDIDADRADQRIVTAAGNATGGVDLPTTTTLPPLPTLPIPLPTIAPPPTVPATTTSTAKATTTVPPTTQPPRATTTRPSPTTTVAAGTMLTIVNEHPLAVVATINGRTFQLAPGAQAGPVAIPRYDHGNDIVEVSVAQEPTCATGDADRYFPTVGSYRMAIVASPGLCQPGMPGPTVKVTRL